MANLYRRRTDLQLANERRRRGDRRVPAQYADGIRFPSLPEQVVQFLTRYLFAGL